MEKTSSDGPQPSLKTLIASGKLKEHIKARLSGVNQQKTITVDKLDKSTMRIEENNLVHLAHHKNPVKATEKVRPSPLKLSPSPVPTMTP